MSSHNSTLLDDSGIQGLEDAVVVMVHTEWNASFVDRMVEGCERTLRRYGVQHIEKLRVPGSFELPFACRRSYEAAARKPDVLIALGCVIRGDTPHFEYVCRAVTDGITRLNLQLPVPVIFGVLTVDDAAQAEARLGGVHGHKGEEAALTALKMAAVNRGLG